ncbi:MAG: ABC transporter permease [Oscillospiraceae bacterium]|nr:ABC transporter permease [Oscillospiraceae bacterium]
MLKYLIKRVLQAVPLLILITVLCFVLINLAPYDAIDAKVTDDMTPEQIEQMREEAGLNDPLPVQYLRWLGGLMRGDLGQSLINRTNIATDLKEKIPNTIKLVLPSYATAFLLAIALGLIAGRYKNSWVDKIIHSAASIGLAVPTFWVGLLFIYFFGLKLDLFPIMGMHSIGNDTFQDFLLHFVMPYMVLTIGFLPDLIRYVRSSTITQFEEDYVLVQKAFGSSSEIILLRHVSKNVLLPMITKLGMALPMLVTGAVITETVFSWPGIGVYFVTAIRNLDYPVVMAVLVLSGTLVILGNLLSDILCALIDPRIRLGR